MLIALVAQDGVNLTIQCLMSYIVESLQKLSCFGIRMANDTKRVDLYLGTPLQSIYVLSVWPARG